MYGESEQSDAGNDAVILEVPDAPINLADNVAITTAYVIGYTWEDGNSYGGTPILDYRLWWDQANDLYAILDEGILPKEYQTKVELTPGAVYTFKI